MSNSGTSATSSGGSWQLGRTDLKYYMLKHNEFAKAMRKVDPSIPLIASAMMFAER